MSLDWRFEVPNAHHSWNALDIFDLLCSQSLDFFQELLPFFHPQSYDIIICNPFIATFLLKASRLKARGHEF